MQLSQYNRNKPQQNEISTTTTDTSRNPIKLAQHNGNKSQHNEISSTQRKQTAACNTKETSRNTIKLAQHKGNKLQPATQRKQVATQ